MGRFHRRLGVDQIPLCGLTSQTVPELPGTVFLLSNQDNNPMEKIILVTPTEAHEQAARDYYHEHIANREPHLHGSSLFENYPSYSDWLAHLKTNSDPKTVPPGWVVSSTFFGVRESDGRIIGMIDIRHELNDFLRDYGGNIGYGVRPTERRKGYATQMLSPALDYCRTLGMARVMISCDKNNPASRNTILHAGGILEKEAQEEDGLTVQIFWITL
jgi:predicted acetyltransferase